MLHEHQRLTLNRTVWGNPKRDSNDLLISNIFTLQTQLNALFWNDHDFWLSTRVASQNDHKTTTIRQLVMLRRLAIKLTRLWCSLGREIEPLSAQRREDPNTLIPTTRLTFGGEKHVQRVVSKGRRVKIDCLQRSRKTPRSNHNTW